MGVFESLNEPGRDGRGLVVRGKHWIFVTTPVNAPKMHRPLALEMYNPIFMGFALPKGNSTEMFTRNSEKVGFLKKILVG